MDNNMDQEGKVFFEILKSKHPEMSDEEAWRHVHGLEDLIMLALETVMNEPNEME